MRRLFSQIVELLLGMYPPQGKGKWVSACAVIKNVQRSVLVVPAGGVFGDADGAIATAEAAAKADPSKKLDLIKLLHVSIVCSCVPYLNVC